MVCFMDDELLTTSDVAKYFRVEAATVRRWIDEGRLVPTARTPGGQYRFTRADLLGEAGQAC